MYFTPSELRTIETAHGERSWAPIPDSCPPEIRKRIVERRAAHLGIKPHAENDEAAELLRARIAAAVQQVSVA
jgi:hypothetical protein